MCCSVSPGLYDHYFNTFLNPIDLLWSFLQAVLMAIDDPVDPHLLRLFRHRRTVRCRRRGGQRGAHLADRRGVGDAAGLTVHLRLQRQLQPVGIGNTVDAQYWVRALAGLATVVVIVAIFALAVGLFQGSFTETVPVTVISPRAGLVMNPDAKVKMRGVQVGKVDSIESRPNGQAVLHLAMDPSQLHLIPANVLVDIASSTVFGAKFVELVPPADPSAQRCTRARCSRASTSRSRSTRSSSN